MGKKRISGFTKKTAEHLLLNAGAYFKNYDHKTDTYETAVAADKLIGATQGGGEFSAVPKVRQIEVDGVPGRAQGLEVIDGWEVYMKANVLEVTEDVLKMSLCAAELDSETNEKYTIIKGKNEIEDNDYIENIAWIGTISGSNEPVIIIVKNALSTDGLKLATKDNNQATVATTFYGHYTQDDLETPPFEILYPKKATESTGTEQNEGEETTV